MIDKTQFSSWLQADPVVHNNDALDRIILAKQRIQNILETQIVAHQKTLEKKVSEQGPNPQRVDPHLVGKAIKDLQELRRLKTVKHNSTGNLTWHANARTDNNTINYKLSKIAPLYTSITQGNFGNLTGDALEIIIQQCLTTITNQSPSFHYFGHFDTSKRNKNGRYKKTQPPNQLSGLASSKVADFILFGFDDGPISIECKNYREWIYPNNSVINDVIIHSYELETIPLLICRKFHYTTLSNYLIPAGILYHESLYQYYPADQAEIAETVKHKQSLGFTDVLATEKPHPITEKFFDVYLPDLVSVAASRWLANRELLYAHACSKIPLHEVYRALGSSVDETLPF